MNSGPLLFLGLFVTMACSWLTFVLGPMLQIGDMRPTTDIIPGAMGRTYPEPEPGVAHQGAEVYRANGCAACHTQQVRPRQLGPDIARGWGVRRSTGYDYLYATPVLLGDQRIGPDLANVGLRMNKAAALIQLYNPRANTPGSVMPPYQFLFDKHKVSGHGSPDALKLPPACAPAAGYEIIPTPAAVALADYIASLHQNGYLFEAPPPFMPKPKTNAPAMKGPARTATNAVAQTNSPAK